ncbi:ABC transporter substrate-binding protein [Methylobacterium sp. CB376]|uniref:ABC transporter substrate-binding protein n=1 Tax=Methylobacterium sp. CB376 TaxID=3138063 RepID=UPI00405346C5
MGYVEGRNLKTEWRWAHGNPQTLAAAAAELAELKVDIFVATATPVANAIKQATSSIPIVLSGTAIAEGAGLVQTLARPGGNVTGVTIMSPELAAKKLQMLQLLVPGVSNVGLFPYINRATPASKQLLKEIEPAAQQARIRLAVHDINQAEDLAKAFVLLKEQGAQALLVCLTPISAENRSLIINLTAHYRIPALYESRVFSEVGGLISYGPNMSAVYRRSAHYIDRIFRGASPGELPVEQPTNFELLINQSTANSLGIAIPREILNAADEVID